MSLSRARKKGKKARIQNPEARSQNEADGEALSGFKKAGKADKSRFLNIAQASLEESRYYLLLALDLGYCDCS